MRDAPSPTVDWLLVGVCLLCYAALQAVFVHPPVLSDQWHYFFDADRLPRITLPHPHHSLRIGLTIPVWAAIQVVGYSEAAYYAVPYLSTAGLVVAVYWLGRLLDSRAAGVAAAVLVVANPVVLDQSSMLLPDLPAATLLTLAVLMLVLLHRHPSGADVGVRRERVLLVGAGVLLGWAYLVREFIVLWYPVLAIVAVVWRPPRRWWPWVAVGTAAMFAFELLWGLVVFGNPFARIWAALHQPASAPWRVVVREQRIAEGVIPDTHLEMLTVMPRNVLRVPGGWVLVALLGVLLVAAVLVRSDALRMLAWWVVVPPVLLMAVIQFAWAFDNRILRAETLRYWLPAVPPLVIGGVIAILALGRRVAGAAGRRVAVGVTAVVALLSVLATSVGMADAATFTRTGGDQFLEFREWVATEGQGCDVLWVDTAPWRSSQRWVPMYLRTFWGRPLWDGELRPLNVGDVFVDVSGIDGGALVRSRAVVRRRRQEHRPVPPYLYRRPRSWPVLLATDRNLVRVHGVGGDCARP